MSLYPAWFRAIRALVKPFFPKMELHGADQLHTPCVYITRHLNDYGPLAVYLYCPFEFHLWVYHVFTEKETCYKQFSEYTFSKRHGMPQGISNFLARVICCPVSAFLHSLRTIPVYRGMKSVLKTMDLSTDALEKGENVLILSDVNYTAEGQSVGELYTGCLHLGKSYYRRTGKRLHFASVNFNRKQHYLRIGQSIEFNPEIPYQQERDRIAGLLQQDLYDDH